MIDLVIYGTTELVAYQTAVLRKLIDTNGLRINPSWDGILEPWQVDRAGIDVCCNHIEVDATLLGADTASNVKHFMVEAMKLVGVFDHCPEHAKRRYWEENEATLLATEGSRTG